MNSGHDRRKLQMEGARENQRTWVSLVLVWSAGLALWLALAALLLAQN